MAGRVFWDVSGLEEPRIEVKLGRLRLVHETKLANQSHMSRRCRRGASKACTVEG